jgi:predicted MPP superfamily phosphohydrolase
MIKINNIKIKLGIIILVTIFLYVSNNWIENSEYVIKSDKLSDSVKIVHLSDLHGKQFGKENVKLFENITKQNPDIIVFTGDLIDASRNNHIEESIQFLERLSVNTPVYYIRGNHEYNSIKYQDIMRQLSEIEGKFYFLEGDFHRIKVKNQNLCVLGLDTIKEEVIDDFLSEDGYKIILNHYSENFLENANLSQLGADLVLTGHAHGGQWRLPIIGGVYSPGQGFNPKYYQGMSEKYGSTHIISRGLGNSIIPIRVFNRPEVVTIVIK